MASPADTPVVGFSSSGVGVTGGSDTGDGVAGRSDGITGIGVFGASINGVGIRASSDQGVALQAQAKASGIGVDAQSKDGVGVSGFSVTSDGVAGRSTTGIGVFGASTSGVGVRASCDAGVALQADAKQGGIGVDARSATGEAVVGTSAANTGVAGLHGNPQLQEIPTIQSNLAGVFGASDIGAGVMGYSRNKDSFGVIAFGGIQASAVNHPFAADFEGDVRINGKVVGDLILANADCAEDFDITGEITAEPGTVMVLNDAGELAPSSQAYDRRVAGVVSGAGHYKPGIVLDRRESPAMRQPIALLGKTFCKVDARFGAIVVGDLLTTSPTPGHAMATNDPEKSFGAVIGKAMRPFAEGQGVIPILIALQ